MSNAAISRRFRTSKRPLTMTGWFQVFPSIALNLASRAHAFTKHRGYVTPEDVKAVGPDVLRHRIILTYEAEAEEITSEQVVRRIFETVEVP